MWRLSFFGCIKSAVFATACLSLFLIISPLYPVFPSGISLDDSWKYGLSQALQDQMAFGRDLIFTYGPFSSLYTLSFNPATDRINLIASAFLGISYLIIFVEWARKNNSFILPYLFVFLLIGFYNHRDAILMLYPILICFWSIQIYLHPNSINSNLKKSIFPLLEYLIYMGALGLLALIKGSFIALVIPAILLVTALKIMAREKIYALLGIICPVASFLLLWYFAKQPMNVIPAYFMAMGEISTGYTEAMFVWGNGFECVLYIISSLSLLAGYYISNNGKKDYKKFANFAGLLSLSLFLFIGFKAGFVRHDLGHSIIAASIIGLASLLVIMFSTRRLWILLLLPFLCWLLINLNSHTAVPEKIFGLYKMFPIAAINGARTRLLYPEYFIDTYKKMWGEISNKCEIPEVTGTVDVYSTDQACLLSKMLDWKPRPIFQSYSAYTRSLSQKNAEHIFGSSAPDNILFKVDPIDNRMPSLEDGASWPPLLLNYDLVKYEKGFLVFSRKKIESITPKYNEISKGIGQLNHEISITPAVNIYGQFDISLTIFGKLLNFLFKPPELNIHVKLKDGSQRFLRFIPSMAKSKFLISPYVGSTDDFMLYAENDKVYFNNNKVTGIRISTNNIFGNFAWENYFSYHLYDVDIPPAAQVENNIYLKKIDPKYLNNLQLKTISCDGNFESLNHAPISGNNINVGKILVVSGWMAVSTEKGIVPDNIFIYIKYQNNDISLFELKRNDRPDVASYFNRKSLINSGYGGSIKLDAEGLAMIGLAQAYNKDIFLCNDAKYISIKEN